ncbi:MAG: lipopolysaccharide transport periplasmic protein LptA [Gammaproteobacteria bacterium]
MKSDRIVKSAILLAGIIMATDGYALSTDREQPIELEADFGEIDDQAQVTTYRGNVVANQGSMRFTGDTLTIHYNDRGKAEKVFLQGKPATYRQLLDAEEEYTEGEALTIEYHAQQELLVLIEKAELTQGAKLLKGHRIDYDVKRNLLKARKATPEELAREPSSQGERIKVILPPAKKDKAE